MSSGSSGVSNASTASASKFQLLSVPKDQSSQNSSDARNSTPDSNQLCLNKKNEPIYAVVNLKDKYENRAKKKSIDEQHVIDYIPRRERPNSFHVVTGDYEEVCMYGSVNSVIVHNELFFLIGYLLLTDMAYTFFCIFQVLQLAVDCVDGCEDDENIYEPVSFSQHFEFIKILYEI